MDMHRPWYSGRPQGLDIRYYTVACEKYLRESRAETRRITWEEFRLSRNRDLVIFRNGEKRDERDIVMKLNVCKGYIVGWTKANRGECDKVRFIILNLYLCSDCHSPDVNWAYMRQTLSLCPANAQIVSSGYRVICTTVRWVQLQDGVMDTVAIRSRIFHYINSLT